MFKILHVFCGYYLLLPFLTIGQVTSSSSALPKDMEAVLKTPIQPKMSLSPDKSMILFEHFLTSSIPIAKLSRSTVQLAGVNFCEETNYAADFLTANSLTFKHTKECVDHQVVSGMPGDAQIFDVGWSPDGTKVAFCNDDGRQINLWLVDVIKLEAKKIFDIPLNFSMEYDLYKWCADSRSLICATIPVNRHFPKTGNRIEKPIVLESDPSAKPNRTYQGLLKNEYDEHLFTYYATSQLVRVDLDGDTVNIGEPGIVLDFMPSPDGTYILTSFVQKPFSYQHTVDNFPSITAIFDKYGNYLMEVNRTSLKQRGGLGKDSQVKEPRDYSWRNDKEATLYWIEAIDGGNADSIIQFRDVVKTLSAPFNGEPEILMKTSYRFYDVFWGNDSIAIVQERWWKDRKMRWLKINPNNGVVTDTLAFYSSDAFIGAPGKPYMVGTNFPVLYVNENGSIYLNGYTYSKEHGVIPVMKRFNLNTRQYDEIWKSSPPRYEFFAGFPGPDERRILVSSQSRERPKNYFITDLSSGNITPVTENNDQLENLKLLDKKNLVYFRSDSVRLNTNLYYPKDLKQRETRLPVLMWAYPVDYKNKEDADQVLSSPYLYSGNYTLQQLLALSGFVVMDFTSFPIIGEEDKEPNDSYLEQISMNAEAALLAAHNTGIADTSKAAIAGHSYGAFMAANLLTHTNLFKTGVAQSGAYNRSLTPFGFQSEYRTYWDEQELYNRISPFQQANKLKYPILLFHGRNDDNPGTFTLQSDRYYEALKGLGKTVRYINMPYEGHIYQAEETKFYVLSEMLQWLDSYLK